MGMPDFNRRQTEMEDMIRRYCFDYCNMTFPPRCKRDISEKRLVTLYQNWLINCCYMAFQLVRIVICTMRYGLQNAV